MGLKAEILERARQAQEEKPLDAITLALHGSMRVKGLGDAEGYLLEELREMFPDIPIFCALDMHTTMTVRMHENCDGFVGFKCAPHTDRYETGIHAAQMTIAALENHVQAKSAWGKGSDSDRRRAVFHNGRAYERTDHQATRDREERRNPRGFLSDGISLGRQ